MQTLRHDREGYTVLGPGTYTQEGGPQGIGPLHSVSGEHTGQIPQRDREEGMLPCIRDRRLDGEGVRTDAGGPVEIRQGRYNMEEGRVPTCGLGDTRVPRGIGGLSHIRRQGSPQPCGEVRSGGYRRRHRGKGEVQYGRQGDRDPAGRRPGGRRTGQDARIRGAEDGQEVFGAFRLGAPRPPLSGGPRLRHAPVPAVLC